MKRYFFYILLIISFAAIRLPAQKAADFHFQKGNDFYLEEQYAEAIREYEAVLNNGMESAELYYNLGNSYYKVGRLGKAILNYERAKKLKPKDENICFNLQLANLRVKDRIDVPPEFFLFRWNRALVQLFSVRGWARLLSLLFLLASVLFAVRQALNLNRFRNICRSGMLALFIAAFLTLFPLAQRYSMEHNRAYGIILQSSTKSLAAPQEGSTELFIVHEGTKVQVLDRDGDWSKIELIDGKQGWILSADLEII